MSEQQQEGWGWAPQSIKLHYFIDGESLCKRWHFVNTDLSADVDDSDVQRICYRCRDRKRQRDLDRIAKQTVPEFQTADKLAQEESHGPSLP